MQNLIKKSRSFELTYHAIERLSERFELNESKLSDSFQRAKRVSTQNSAKFGKVYIERVIKNIANRPNCAYYVNTYHDMTFIVDESNHTIVTAYSFSDSLKPYFKEF